jgi:hypothetical protein
LARLLQAARMLNRLLIVTMHFRCDRTFRLFESAVADGETGSLVRAVRKSACSNVCTIATDPQRSSKKKIRVLLWVLALN